MVTIFFSAETINPFAKLKTAEAFYYFLSTGKIAGDFYSKLIYFLLQKLMFLRSKNVSYYSGLSNTLFLRQFLKII
jgi:hypothetical protein